MRKVVYLVNDAKRCSIMKNIQHHQNGGIDFIPKRFRYGTMRNLFTIRLSSPLIRSFYPLNPVNT
jgi:hypothetical protein